MFGPHFVRGKTVRDGIPDALFFRILSGPGFNPVLGSALFCVVSPGAWFSVLADRHSIKIKNNGLKPCLHTISK